MLRTSAKQHTKALGAVLSCLAFSLLLYHSLAGGTLLSANVYDSYALQAENWLAGRNYILDGENRPWLELAVYGGRYYQSFPPVPGVVLLPWVLLCGGATAVPSNLVAALLLLGIATGVYCCMWRCGAEPVTAATLAVFCTAGSGTYWLGCSGGVWFMAQLCGLCFAVWGLFFALRPGSVTAVSATSFCFAAAVGCRPFYALLGLIWGLRLVREVVQGRCAARLLLPAVLPAACVGAGMAAYNFARFGNPLEFGHNYLPEFMRADYGQFDWHYLPGNLLNLLRPVTLDSRLQLHFEVFNGFLFTMALPIFLLWFFVALRRIAPSERLPLPVGGWVLAGLCLLITLGYCAHRTLGGWQFGARYLVDLLPYPLLYFMARPHWRPGAGAVTLCALAVLFQLYGAVFMLSA